VAVVVINIGVTHLSCTRSSTLKKVFVLDTNVILVDSECIYKFQEHTVIIPMPVIEEVDHFKKNNDELGRNARAFSRNMDVLRKKGDLLWDDAMAAFSFNGPVIVNDDGGMLKVALYVDCYGDFLPCGTDMNKPDNQILACALSIPSNEESVTILVTRDINLRIKGDICGLETQDYENGKVETDDLYQGCDRVWVTENSINSIHELGRISADIIGPEYMLEEHPNIGLLLCSEINEKHSALCMYDHVMRELVLLPDDQTTMAISPRNNEQKFALNLLMNPEIEIVTMTGKAGSGKTLMALVGALHGILDAKLYDKIVLLKPIIAADNANELGFLPGDMDEKLKPWMASYSDNLQVIMGNFSKEDLKIGAKKAGKKMTKAEQKAHDECEEKEAGRIGAMDELKALGLLEYGSLEHMRGRSLPKQYIILDEAQNVTPKALKTIITRAGEGTKIIIMGDISQIDNPYLDATSNGLTYIIDRFKSQVISGQVAMKKSERSRLAELAADIL
jgi:PhoH-like ATPase